MSEPIDELLGYLRAQVSTFRQFVATCPVSECEACVNNRQWADKLDTWVDAVTRLRDASTVYETAAPSA